MLFDRLKVLVECKQQLRINKVNGPSVMCALIHKDSRKKKDFK